MTEVPTIGRIVHYKLNESDTAAVNWRQDKGGGPDRANLASPGDIYPAMIVRIFDPGAYVQLQVFIDGNFTIWATSRTEGTGEGQWQWPPRV